MIKFPFDSEGLSFFTDSLQGGFGKIIVKKFRCLLPDQLRCTVCIEDAGNFFSLATVKTSHNKHITFRGFNYFSQGYLVRRPGKKVATFGSSYALQYPSLLEILKYLFQVTRRNILTSGYILYLD